MTYEFCILIYFHKNSNNFLVANLSVAVCCIQSSFCLLRFRNFLKLHKISIDGNTIKIFFSKIALLFHQNF